MKKQITKSLVFGMALGFSLTSSVAVVWTQAKAPAQQSPGAALEREGLTMERYGALFQTVSADERLREKVLKLIEEEQAKS